MFLDDLESEDESISVHDSSSDSEYAPTQSPAARKVAAAAAATKKKKMKAAAEAAKTRRPVIKTERKVALLIRGWQIGEYFFGSHIFL